ncbi:MAG TPA: deoxyguanosinetriphosphate triphosphohydrolase [Streptosporangiaceae bacterium]|nr:deoxyguanosinetriphosphate triphosphohydrolase [Streptosporangiaceae bacterium]
MARLVPEGPKRAGRDDFERDRARVLHSSALRRLSGKTQVVAPLSGDFPRTRLTHSLECAQIGRELAREVGCDPDLADAACLAHDVGHSPFGHNGEAALNALCCSEGMGGFEGNAQTLRLLTRLEVKVPGVGLNLTRATLDATLKYPWFPDGAAKYGVYPEDAEVFAWIRAGAPERRLCLEAQVMDWADDVAYSVHDVEDGLHAGLIKFTTLISERRAVAGTAIDLFCGALASEDELIEILDGLLALPAWPRSFDGSEKSLAALKHLTSDLIGRFCVAARDATLAAAGRTAPVARHALTRYDADLLVPRRQRLECALLKAIAVRYVMARSGAAEQRARERELLTELVDAVERGAPGTLDPLLRPAWTAADSDAARRRVVIDQVASLTDTSAIAWHHRLCSGVSITTEGKGPYRGPLPR